MKQASTRWKFHFFAQNPKNWQNHDLYSFLFGTEVMMCQKNREGWLVGVWDGNRWDPSHPFRISSHSHPTRRCTVILPFNWIFMKFPNLKYPLFGLFSSSNWRPCIAGCFDYPWTVARSNGKSNSNVESNLEIKLGFPHTTPLPGWLLSECNNFTQFLLDVYVCIFSNLQCFECLAAVFHIDCTLDRWRLEIKCFIPWKLLCFGNIMIAHQNNLKILGGINHFISRN